MLDLKHTQKKRQKSVRHLCSFEPEAPLSAQEISQDHLAALASEDGQLFFVNLKNYRYSQERALQTIKADSNISLSKVSGK